MSEPIGPMGFTASEAVSILGGSSDRMTAMKEWGTESSRRRSVPLSRKQQKEILDMLMAKIIARDYTLLTYCPAGGFFADMFIIQIRNNNGSSWKINLCPWRFQIIPEDNNRLLWFEALEFFVGPWFPHSWQLKKIFNCLMDQC